MVEKTKPCDGCEVKIIDGEKNVIDILEGTADWDEVELVAQSGKSIWFGHRKCFDERFQKK